MSRSGSKRTAGPEPKLRREAHPPTDTDASSGAAAGHDDAGAESLADEDARELRRGCEQLGLELDEAAPAQIAVYVAELRRWAARMDLISRGDLDVVVPRHIVDSLVPTVLLPDLRGRGRIADFGSGAGLPGVPLAIALRPARMVLVESRQRKVSFLRAIARALPQLRLEVAHRRTEALGFDAGGFDAVISRAAMSPHEVFRAASRILRHEGRLVLYRGPHQRTDEPPRDADRECGRWTFSRSLSYRLPGIGAELRLDLWSWCFT